MGQPQVPSQILFEDLVMAETSLLLRRGAKDKAINISSGIHASSSKDSICIKKKNMFGVI